MSVSEESTYGVAETLRELEKKTVKKKMLKAEKSIRVNTEELSFYLGIASLSSIKKVFYILRKRKEYFFSILFFVLNLVLLGYFSYLIEGNIFYSFFFSFVAAICLFVFVFFCVCFYVDLSCVLSETRLEEEIRTCVRNISDCEIEKAKYFDKFSTNL